MRFTGLGTTPYCHYLLQYTIFVGVTLYADDVILLAPSRSALQEMLKVTENFAKKHIIVFSTNADPNKSKSKCILFSGKTEDQQKCSLPQ